MQNFCKSAFFLCALALPDSVLGLMYVYRHITILDVVFEDTHLE